MANTQYLSQAEIDDFVDHLDHDQDGCISYSELELILDAVYRELEPNARHYNLHHDSRVAERHAFLRSMMGTDKSHIPAEEFKQTVASWKIPSLEKDRQAAKAEDNYFKNVNLARRLRAHWEVKGPEYLFLFIVISLQISLGIWQCVKYSTGSQYQAALGWGVGLAKACAGALYPTLFFMLLSMSRWFSTWLRQSYYISRVINWDLSQSFHIKISCIAIILATLHAIGHLAGSFVFGSQPDRQAAVAALLGPNSVPKPYISYIRSTPGWTGLTALGLFYLLAILSIPYIRKWSYEIFQLGHLLMFPIIGLLMAHGSAALLQFPVLGIILAFPTLLVSFERVTRLLAGLHKIPATLSVLDDETVAITCEIPKSRFWRYKAGQYVFLQVPQLSFFQWHPFTISTCVGRKMTLHIKTDGDWTARLRNLQGDKLKYVGIDGPFGAPAQRFYDFDQSIIIGAGIGVTPFSGILNDLQFREHNHWRSNRRYSSSAISSAEVEKEKDSADDNASTLQPSPSHTTSTSTTINTNTTTNPNQSPIDTSLYRRVDFHWIVRDKNHLSWFSSLLNRLSSPSPSSSSPSLSPHLDLRIHNHLTKKREHLPTHILRLLLERHRTPSHPVSPLTGLIAPTHFGRPDFPRIFDEHYEDMVELFRNDDSEREREGKRKRKRSRKVGVFFCGAPVIGGILADLCRQMTVRGRQDGTEIEYHFLMEVFG